MDLFLDWNILLFVEKVVWFIFRILIYYCIERGRRDENRKRIRDESKGTAASRLCSQSIVLLPSLLTPRVNYLDRICSIMLPTQEREA